ncbi:hypothetical protein Ocin01_08990 [Orchesella cincta]|uniref:Uncharacterized protein n=1 Tax=Orchesella cincta TaxID=48709 RepID=A0A1D2MY08_ORCCI|nr:hypothetical protein Ocin01_08990 [Orchesella cincta]
MCNLCSDRLFLVPNPCCCCVLRCGTIWAGAVDIFVGLTLLYFPNTNYVASSTTYDKANINNTNDDNPVFDVIIPVTDEWEFREMQRVGCPLIQIVTGLMVVVAATLLGNRHFNRFLIGCTWMFFRLIILLFLLPLLKALWKSPHGPHRRYGLYLAFKIIFDIYLFVVIRYYTMECYDLYRYQLAAHSVMIRREQTMFSKAASKTQKVEEKPRKKGKKDIAPPDDKKDGKNKNEKRDNKPEPAKKTNLKSISEFRDHYHKNVADVEDGPVPVWDRKNEITFYGEDYTDWEPHLFQTRWDLLHEQEIKVLNTLKSLNLKSRMKQSIAPAQNDEPDKAQKRKSLLAMGDGGGGDVGGKKLKSGGPVSGGSGGDPSKRKSFKRSDEEPGGGGINKPTTVVKPEAPIIDPPKGKLNKKGRNQGGHPQPANKALEDEEAGLYFDLPKTDEEVQPTTGEDEGPPVVIQKGKKKKTKKAEVRFTRDV